MSPDKNSTSVRVLIHSLLQASRQVLLERCVFDNWDLKGIEVAQHALALASWNALDLLNVADLKAAIFAFLPLHEQSYKDRPLGVCMNAAASTTVKRSQEKRRASRRFQFPWLADVFARRRGVLRSGIGEDEDFIGLDHFLLNAGGGNEDMVILPDGRLHYRKHRLASCLARALT